MSGVGRACLRLAACAALRGVTLAGENIFDSRIEAIDLSQEGQVGAAIAVYAEQDDGDALDNTAGPPFRPTVDLVLEITMQVRGPVQKDGSYQVGTPVTDDQLEASLDVLETQTELALFRSYAAASVLFRKVSRFSRRKNSIRFTDPQGGAKLATRFVTYSIEIADEEIPVAYDPSLTGFARLPEPFATIASAWPDGPEKKKAAQIAAALSGAAPPPLLGVKVSVPPPPSTMTPGNQPDAPVQADWELPQ